MGTTPVRVRHEDKDRLERLRQELTATTGHRPTQQELIGKAVEFALRHKDEFVAEVAWKPMPTKNIERWLKAARSGPGWDPVPVDEIDRLVYGDG